MTIEDRRARERAARRQLIVSTARSLAEAEGWDAVTTRRLSQEIEYSQPVLYKHFQGMDQIAEAVAIDGFGELAEDIGTARAVGGDARDVLIRTAQAYLDFARRHPSVYDAMFTRATSLDFAADDTPPALQSAFNALRDAVAAVADDRDVDDLTEVLWATLHGLVALGRTGRIRPDRDRQRIVVLVDQMCR
ncbi:TetR/AcrR family transcriptional regulator [Mycolicibacterium sp. 018/SC-01/001]|uniref:TetR/AcrR family transcriptional regulator n=1 Tax=Mycolicibacterium sp. 018/SC-01/001 TaxID=2592069 RepID=UPI00117D0EA1|nr:TetR/AcrR family transcriptional regulator [Mycolicibacterium sp. 018/SC-01/001]TRW81189.1 TetR/AcrR family transcriptional regulator [Mycolicibacterium sp. 018/SC-01/001]